MNVETGCLAELPSGPVVEAVLAAGAAVAASSTTTAVTSTVHRATAVAAAARTSGSAGGAGHDELQAGMDICPEPSPETQAQAKLLARWDAHLDNPLPQLNPSLQPLEQAEFRGSHGLTGPAELKFMEIFEFISMGCFCAPSYALQMLGLKRYSYPFDWVRSSIDGIIHCLNVQFQDFLTYSTSWMQDQYLVFGGTRWGGSFWHHNLEAPVTQEDMLRRVQRLYGVGEVAASKPRFFVRCVNSTREIDSATRLREALRKMLPEAEEVLLLIIVDVQSSTGPMAVAGEAGHGVLFYQISDAETSKALIQGARGLPIWSRSHATAIAFAVRYWAGCAGARSNVRMFADLAQLSAVCEQWDGGDPARELFLPRKFYGRRLDVFSGVPKMQRLCAPLQLFSFVLPADVDAEAPLPVECFGKYLRVHLPKGACGGHVLQLYCNEGQLSGAVGVTKADGQMVCIATAMVEEQSQA